MALRRTVSAFRRERVVAVGVRITDLTVWPMDDHFAAFALRLVAGRIGRFALGAMGATHPAGALRTRRPSVAVGYYMDSLGHLILPSGDSAGAARSYEDIPERVCQQAQSDVCIKHKMFVSLTRPERGVNISYAR